MNYLQNRYNTFRLLLKTSLYYGVKHKSIKMLQLLYHSLLTKLSTPPFKKLKLKEILLYLLIYRLVQQCVPITSSRR